MTEIHDFLYLPKEHDPRISHRRFDAKERLVAWSVRQDDHYLHFRVDAFREVTLENGEKLDVPESIRCQISESDMDPKEAFAEDDAILPGAWAGGEFDAGPQLQYNHARCYDPTPGWWLGEEPLGHEPGSDDFLRYPQ